MIPRFFTHVGIITSDKRLPPYGLIVRSATEWKFSHSQSFSSILATLILEIKEFLKWTFTLSFKDGWPQAYFLIV